jgi:hypothetical protein
VKILLDDDLIIWDTESDGRGGTHTLEKTREWGFRKVKTGVGLSSSGTALDSNTNT